MPEILRDHEGENMKRPTVEELERAATWLENNEGDDVLHVAGWLRVQAEAESMASFVRTAMDLIPGCTRARALATYKRMRGRT